MGRVQYLVGLGQGVTRMLQLSGILATAEHKDVSCTRTRLQRCYTDPFGSRQMKFWEATVREYFTPRARLRFTLWKDNLQQEAKPFGAYIVVFSKRCPG